jgi:6-phosphogluconolactonase
MIAAQKRFPTAEAAARACGDCILELLQEALAATETASLAVSGGSTPKLMFSYLARAVFDWSAVHLFWVDERAVPPSDAQSNYRLADESFITPAHFPRRNVHRIQAEIDPHRAARLYESEIREFFGTEPGDLPHFDVIHLGMGAEGHTASLFPGEPLIENRDHLVAAVQVPAAPLWRITLLPGVLLAARNTLFLVAGDDKADSVREVFQGEHEPRLRPAQLITHKGRRVSWFMDAGAARLLSNAAPA